MEDLQGKVAVITGGASGIGRAVAQRVAAEGMKIVLGDVEEEALTGAVDGSLHPGPRPSAWHRRGRPRLVRHSAPSARPLRRRAPRAQQCGHRVGRPHLGGHRGGLALDPGRQPVGRHPWRPRLHAALDRAGRGAHRQHGVHRGSHRRPVPRSLQRHQAGRGGHFGDTLQGPPDGRRRRSASRSSAPASCRHALRNPTGTGRTGARGNAMGAAEVQRRRADTWSTVASRRTSWRTGSSTPSAPTPSTSSRTPSSTSPSPPASTTLCRGGRPARR